MLIRAIAHALEATGLCFLAVSSVTLERAVAQNTQDPNAPYDPDTATVGLYHLNETSGAIADDASSNGFDGTVIGASWTPLARFGGALSFDGDDYVFLPDSSAFDTDDATFEAWVFVTSFPPVNPMVLIDKQRPEEGGRRLHITANGTPQVLAYTTDTNALSLASATTQIQVNQWVHIAAVFDDTNGRLKVLVNGVIEDNEALLPNTNAPHRINVGRSQSPVAGYFIGRIDEVRISNVARSLNSQVGVPVEPTTWGRLKALWR